MNDVRYLYTVQEECTCKNIHAQVHVHVHVLFSGAQVHVPVYEYMYSPQTDIYDYTQCRAVDKARTTPFSAHATSV